jgi:hypothetical protein
MKVEHDASLLTILVADIDYVAHKLKSKRGQSQLIIKIPTTFEIKGN